MKLKELLIESEFDAVVPYICSVYPSQVRSLPHYKEVFDRLRHTEPVELEESIEVSWYRYSPTENIKELLSAEEMKYVEKPRISVHNCEGDNFTNNLGKEIVVADDVRICREELVARILWSMTFHGFCEEDWEETARQIFDGCWTEYGERANDLNFRYYYKMAPDKRAMKRYYKENGAVFASMEEWAVISLREARCNRSRRKRNYRMWHRIEQLRRMDKRERLIRRLTESPDEPGFRREDLTFLYETERVIEVKCHSYAYEPSARVNYIRELIEKYGARSPFDYSSYKGFIVHVRVAQEHPIIDVEWAELQRIVMRMLPTHASIKWGVGHAQSLGMEIAVSIVCYR